MDVNVATLPPDFAQHMAMAFDEPMPAPAVNTPAPAQSEPGAPQQQTAVDPPTPLANQPINQPAEEGVQYVDPNVYLKEHLGFETWETAKNELQVLRDLQQKASTPAEIKYANDEAKRWMEYFTGGKENELREALNARHQVNGVDSMNDEQKIKLFIKMNNPFFDQELVDYEFQRNYGFDESQFKDENGVVTDALAYRHAKVASLQRMQSDLGKAQEYFTQYKSKIELPEINKPGPASVDEGYESYKARTATATESYEKAIAPALKALSEADLNMSFNIDDPNNQIKFDLGIAVDKADFESARTNALSYSDWVEQTFYDQNGNFQPKKLARAILLEQNFDKYVQTIARQSVNAERKRMIDKETPNGERRDFNVDPGVMTELDQKMKMAFSV